MENKVVLGVYCVIESEDKILLTEDVGKPGWKLPGGKVDLNETLEAAVKREVEEEVGLKIEPTEIFAIEEYINPVLEHRIRIFVSAKYLSGTIKLADGEVSKSIWVSKEELTNMKESEFFKDFIYKATRKYLSRQGVSLNNFLITTIRKAPSGDKLE